LHKIRSRVELDHYLGLLAQRLGISESSLRADLRRALPEPAAGRHGRSAVSPPAAPPSAPLASWKGAERILLHLWFHRRLETSVLSGRIGPEDFSHPTAQALMRLISQSADWDAADPVQAVSAAAAAADDTLAAAVAHLSLLELEYDSVEQAVEECLKSLDRRRLDGQVRQLEQDRQAAEAEGNQQRVRELQVAILDSRRSLGGSPG
jgi:hypothetical protein